MIEREWNIIGMVFKFLYKIFVDKVYLNLFEFVFYYLKWLILFKIFWS